MYRAATEVMPFFVSDYVFIRDTFICGCRYFCVFFLLPTVFKTVFDLMCLTVHYEDLISCKCNIINCTRHAKNIVCEYCFYEMDGFQ